MELSNFTLGLALHGLQCGMMVKARDNARSSLDEWMNVPPNANFQRSVKTPNINQFSKFKVYKKEQIFPS